MKRLSREQFWKYFTIPFLITYFLIAYLHLNDDEFIEEYGESFFMLGIIFCILGIIYCVYIFIKRINDFDFSGWYAIGFIILFIFSLDYKPFGLYLLLFLFIIIILLHFKKGNPGANRFGGDPYNLRSEFIENTLSKKIENKFYLSKKGTNTIINSKIDNIKSYVNIEDLKKQLVDKEWKLLNSSTIFIFQKNNELLKISENEVLKCKYEIVENKFSIIIHEQGKSSFYKVHFEKNGILNLNKLASNEILNFVESQ